MAGARHCLECFWTRSAFPLGLPLSQWEDRPPLVSLDRHRVDHLEFAVLYLLAQSTFYLPCWGICEWAGLRPACPDLSLWVCLQSDAAPANQVGCLGCDDHGLLGDRAGFA